MKSWSESIEKQASANGVTLDKCDSSKRFSNLPPWFDKAKFESAKDVYSNHFFSVNFMYLSGLIILVYIKSIFETLTLTRNSSTLVSTFYRYFRTLMHVKRWHEGDVLDPNDAANKSIQSVSKPSTGSSQCNCKYHASRSSTFMSKPDGLS